MEEVKAARFHGHPIFGEALIQHLLLTEVFNNELFWGFIQNIK
jgi:hypothetical protein